jgi:hypothetical protein
MEFIKIFIIIQLIFLSFQFIYPLKLESFQYSELIFGSIFIIVFFGFFGSILTLDIIQQEQSVLNNSALIPHDPFNYHDKIDLKFSDWQ